MARSRGMIYVINNYTTDDIAAVMDMQHIHWVTYIIAGFEIGEGGTPHIQGYMHFKDAKTLKCLSKYLQRAHLEIPWIKGSKTSRRWEYCKKDGDFWEWGTPPQVGINKVTSSMIVDAIKQGLTYKEILEKYPSYCLHHRDKVKRFIAELAPKQETKFYKIEPMADSIQEVVEFFDCDTEKMAVVMDLCDLEAYADYDTVLLILGAYDFLPVMNLWPRGVPITYKYGYECKVVNVKRFIISTPNSKLLNDFYKLIPY